MLTYLKMNGRDFNIYEENYKKLPFEPIMIEYRRKVVIENIFKHKHDHVLEIGCGNEPLYRHFSDYISMTIIEPCKSFYENAICHKKDNIKIFNGTFENAGREIMRPYYDFIVISCLLHEIENPAIFLRKVLEVCNSETTVHINVPNAKSFHRVLALKSNLISSVCQTSENQILMQQYCVFDLPKLNKLVVECGFEVIKEGSYFIKPFTHLQMQALIDNKIINQEILDGLFEITELLPGWGAEIFVNVKPGGKYEYRSV